MSHPGPLLADYVDGTLDPSTRAEVDAHLRTCATCRGELALSRAGAAAAHGLGEPAVPTGLGDDAIAEAARLAGERTPEVSSIAGRARRRPTTSRVLAAVGAAAAVLLLVAIAPKLGQNSSHDLAANAGAAQAQNAYPPATGVEVQHAEYSSDALTQVVTALRSEFMAAAAPDSIVAGVSQPAAGGSETTKVPAFPAAQDDAAADPSMLPKATACLNQAGGSPSGTLSRVILARYQGQPAYFGVYLLGPGAELPPTVLQVTVASVHGCQLLNQTAARL